MYGYEYKGGVNFEGVSCTHGRTGEWRSDTSRDRGILRYDGSVLGGVAYSENLVL